MSHLLDKEFILEIARGAHPNMSLVHVTGSRPSASGSGTDIWEGSASSLPRPVAAGEQLACKSLSADDTDTTGSGIRKLLIHYLDANGDEATTPLNMNGSTEVLLTPTNVRAIQFVHATEVGTGGVAAGEWVLFERRIQRHPGQRRRVGTAHPVSDGRGGQCAKLRDC